MILVTYKVHPGHFVPDWFDAAFKKAASTKAVAQAAAIAAAALKAADDAYMAAHDTASHELAHNLWVLADINKNTAKAAMTAVIAAFADVDFTAAVNAVKSVNIDWGGA